LRSWEWSHKKIRVSGDGDGEVSTGGNFGNGNFDNGNFNGFERLSSECMLEELWRTDGFRVEMIDLCVAWKEIIVFCRTYGCGNVGNR